MKFSFFLKKTLSSILIVIILLTNIFAVFTPKKAEAAWPTWNFANVVQSTISAATNSVTAGATSISAATSISGFMKTYILDTVATAFARAMLRKITAQTVNWINTGFKGNPAFVTDPGQFFLDVGDQTASKFFLNDKSPLNQLCSDFRPQVRLALVKSYLQEDVNQSRCTFSKIGTNFNNFTRDFNQGGWNAWFTMTQQNQNNPYGAYLDASKQLSARIGTQNQKYDKQLLQGKGFLSFEVCPEGKTYKERAENGVPVGGNCSTSGDCGEGLVCSADMTCQPLTEDNVDIDGQGRIEPPKPTDCTVATKTVTPGSVISEKLTKSLNSPEMTLELTNSINQIVNALMTQMVSQVFNSVQGGLRGLSKSQAGEKNSLLDSIQESAKTENYLKEKAAIEATTPTQFRSAIDGGTADPVYTPPTEDEARRKAELDRQRYLLETGDTSGMPPATTTTP